MNYQLSFDGALSAELAHLLRSMEMHLNGQGLKLQAQATGTADSTGATGTTSTTPRCNCGPGQVCLDSIKIGHDICVSLVGLLVVTVLVTAVIAVPIAYKFGQKSAT